MSASFDLDPRLTTGSHPVMDWPLCHLRLKDDARFLWLLLIPRRPDIVELTDLDATAYADLCTEIRRACELVRTVDAPDKLNVATLGNVVPQMHVHVVGRRRSDPAWPDPIWCHPPGATRPEGETRVLLERLRHAAG